jgi:hypothetical protein
MDAAIEGGHLDIVEFFRIKLNELKKKTRRGRKPGNSKKRGQ